MDHAELGRARHVEHDHAALAGGHGTVHHVVDPSTGAPATEVWRTVSVNAWSCLDANIASTAAIVRGEEAARWLESLALPSRLVRRDGSVLPPRRLARRGR